MDRYDWQERIDALAPSQRQLLAQKVANASEADPSTASKRRIVAYAATDQEAYPEESELRRFLAASLPEYMVPSQFIFLDELPRTPNGKLDRRSLPDPALDLISDGLEFEPPATETEKTIAAIWADTLETPIIGRTDDFFELGGHSLLVTQLVSRLRKAFQIELSLDLVFEASTVRQQAEFIDNIRWLTEEKPTLDSDEAREDFVI